jgi:hypothetical protein
MEDEIFFKATVVLDPTGKVFTVSRPKYAKLVFRRTRLSIGNEHLEYSDISNPIRDDHGVSFEAGGKRHRFSIQEKDKDEWLFQVMCLLSMGQSDKAIGNLADMYRTRKKSYFSIAVIVFLWILIITFVAWSPSVPKSAILIFMVLTVLGGRLMVKHFGKQDNEKRAIMRDLTRGSS